MWRALSDAIESNPDSASHFAIVMAVAAARGATDDGKSPATVTLKAERQDAQAIDYVKALAPALISTVGNVGTAAILADQTKASIRANRDVRIVEAGVEGQIYDVLGAAVTGGEYTQNTDVTDVTDTTPDTTPDTTTPAEDTTTPAEDIIDPSEDVVDPSEDETPTEEPAEVDCSGPQFSPINPACQ